MKPEPSSLRASNLGVSAGERRLVTGLTVSYAPGEFVAILGRNGCGKTLTLHTLAGLRPPLAGEVELEGQPLTRLSRRNIARRLGVLTQDLEDGFASTVLESLLIGRHPHLALLEREGPEDRRLAQAALVRVGLPGFADRSAETLSGGEQRRCAMAALLTQDPQIYLLDEPSNHLDPQQQLAVLGLFKEETRRGRTVIAILHDPTLAARFADSALLLYGDGNWLAGPATQVLNASALSQLYETPLTEVSAGSRRVFTSL
ncbi:MAG TPA: ABC transporter ATP-binding protein [Steroidobacteraceae bacterium]